MVIECPFTWFFYAFFVCSYNNNLHWNAVIFQVKSRYYHSLTWIKIFKSNSNRKCFIWHRKLVVFIIQHIVNMAQLAWYDQRWQLSLVIFLILSMVSRRRLHILHGIIAGMSWKRIGWRIFNCRCNGNNCRDYIIGCYWLVENAWRKIFFEILLIQIQTCTIEIDWQAQIIERFFFHTFIKTVKYLNRNKMSQKQNICFSKKSCQAFTISHIHIK